MKKATLLAVLMLAPAVFVSAEEIKVNATGSVDAGVVNVEVVEAGQPNKTGWDLATGKGKEARTAGEVDVNVDIAVPTVDMVGVVETMVDSTSTVTSTDEAVVDAELEAKKEKWIEVLSYSSAAAKVAWEPTDYSLDPATMVEGDVVTVTTTQEVSLFGFIKIQMELTGEADMEGNVTNIKKPWYAMFAW